MRETLFFVALAVILLWQTGAWKKMSDWYKNRKSKPTAQPLTAPAPQATPPPAAPETSSPRSKRWLWALLAGLIAMVATYYFLEFGSEVKIPDLGSISTFATSVNRNIYLALLAGVGLFFVFMFPRTTLFLGLVAFGFWFFLTQPNSPPATIVIKKWGNGIPTTTDTLSLPYRDSLNCNFKVKVLEGRVLVDAPNWSRPVKLTSGQDWAVEFKEDRYPGLVEFQALR